MNIKSLLALGQPTLTEGSVYELLRRDSTVKFDLDLAHAALIFDRHGRRVLEMTHRAYFDIAHRHRLPLLAFTDTWRANQERIARSAFRDCDLNRANADFLCGIRDSYRESPEAYYVGGLIGCRGNAYDPREAISTNESQRFHSPQIESLADSNIDFLFAATLPALSEAKGIAMAMATTRLPYILSFVITPHGTLLDGTAIDRTVQEIDSSVATRPLGYYLNCIHPQIVTQALESGNAETICTRFIGLQANTSALSPRELDEVEELQTEDPVRFSAMMMDVAKRCEIQILGGCCGTDTTHMEHLARQIRVLGSRRRTTSPDNPGRVSR
jgi:homocysteine S-methyltransferase